MNRFTFEDFYYKSFLAAYKATVEVVEKGDSSAVKNVKAAMKRVAGSYTPVAPLLGGIVWSQGEPFNNLCPKYDGEHTAVTGCVGCHALSSISLPCTLQQLDSCSIVCSARMKEMKLKLADVPENFAVAINHGQWRGWPDYYSQVSTKNFLTLYVPASSVEAYKQEVGQYFKAILPLAETGINQPSLDGIAISAQHGNIVISGLKDGTLVKLYAVDGKYIGENIANQGSVSFNCNNENMVIAKIGSKSMKIAISR